MNTTTKRIMIGVAALTMFGILIWSSTRVAEHRPFEETSNTTGTISDYYNFSKDITEELQKKQEVSEDGKTAKEALLAPLNGEAGVLFDGPNFKIEHYPALTSLSERFVVELKSPDFNALKELTRQWFLDRGFSNDDVCNLPIAFYPSPEVISSYPSGEAPEINPVLENCDEQ